MPLRNSLSEVSSWTELFDSVIVGLNGVFYSPFATHIRKTEMVNQDLSLDKVEISTDMVYFWVGNKWEIL